MSAPRADAEPLFLHETPADGWWHEAGEPAGNTLADVLNTVVALFVGSGKETCSRVRPRDTGSGDRQAVLLLHAPPRRILVAGNGRLAERLRTALRNGTVPEWGLIPLPETRTPLHYLADRISPQTYRTLTDTGFTCVEEVAATPDACLLKLRRTGPKSLAAVRAAVAATPNARPSRADGPTPQPEPAETASRLDYLRSRLAPTHRARYDGFAERLATSGLPVEALDAVVDSLNAEPSPPADSQP